MLPTLLLVLTFAAAALDWISVAGGWDKLEQFAKPAVMLALFFWLAAAGRLQGASLWFGLGLLFSLIGDVLLLPGDRFFLPGLAAFALVHLAYLIGFGSYSSPLNLSDVIPALALLLIALGILYRLSQGLAAKGLRHLILPVRVYGLLISLMLFFALRTLYTGSWQMKASLLASLGAFLFYLSDLLLAWNKFIAPLRLGRLWNMIAYHLGQIALIAGVVLQFSNPY